MKLLVFFTVLIIVGFFSWLSLDRERFISCAAWILLPMIAGYLLKRTQIPDITELGRGIFFGSLTVFIAMIGFLIYHIATWKMTRLF